MSTLLSFFAPIFLTPLLPPIAMQVGEAGEEAAGEDAFAETPTEEPTETAPEEATEEAAAPTPAETARAAPSAEEAGQLAAQLRQREDIRVVHRAFGIATWIAAGASVVIGGLTFNDEYGSANFGTTPCARFQPTLSQSFCRDSIQVPMLTIGVTTTLLYFTTFTLSFLMPDPLGVADAPGWAGERLRIHKALRWAHLATMLATTVFGFITGALVQDCSIPSECQSFYEMQQALGAVHLGLGVATFGLITAAGAVMLF